VAAPFSSALAPPPLTHGRSVPLVASSTPARPRAVDSARRSDTPSRVERSLLSPSQPTISAVRASALSESPRQIAQSARTTTANGGIDRRVRSRPDQWPSTSSERIRLCGSSQRSARSLSASAISATLTARFSSAKTYSGALSSGPMSCHVVERGIPSTPRRGGRICPSNALLLLFR